MASPSELSLDCKPHSYSMLLKSFGEQADPTQKLEEVLVSLEEERFKIDGLKRELPLCMQLLNNAVEVSRQQLQAYRANQGPRPVFEEFIPLKNSSSENSETKSQNISDKANWMTTAQLWSQTGNNETKPQTTITSPKESDAGFNVSPKLGLHRKPRNAGAFLPFSKERNSCPSSTLRALPDLALASIDKEMEDKKCTENEIGRRSENPGNNKVSNGGVVIEQVKGGSNSTEGQTNSNNTTNTQSHRKARRCWSPDLHHRFVNALQVLGGSQADLSGSCVETVATPKQIRELMKVDGLTNDEVKSHLQKYRLHTRRPSPSPQAPGGPAPPLVVLGGIWVPSDYATAAAAHSATPALYQHPSSHIAPHFCAASPVPQDFYSAATPAPTPAMPPLPPAHHQLHLHNQIHMYKATSQGHSSPESDFRAAGDRSESIEDGKSDSSSLKGESGENGVGEKKDGESNGSEITLQF